MKLVIAKNLRRNLEKRMGSRTMKEALMDTAPNISESTIEERRAYIKRRFPCLADCDMCGLCSAFHGKDPEVAYDDYIKGTRSFEAVSADYK